MVFKQHRSLRFGLRTSGNGRQRIDFQRNAFQRVLGNRRLVCIAPRLTAKLTGGARPWAVGDAWGEARVRLPSAGRFVNAFTGERREGGDLRMAEVLSVFPVAWLTEAT